MGGGMLVVCFLAAVLAPARAEDLDWWKHATIYQIYPKSFQDSDGDGIGDLRGIINRLPYIEELGVDAVWLSPIYPSGGADGGYDIVDYTSIDPIFGTFDDFKNLTQELKKINIKLIMDFVPNHTSLKHKWFQASRKGDDQYKDYYVWRNKTNNWVSVLGGSAWTWDDTRKEYYLHQFMAEQPDLNYRNEQVLQEMKNILKFWVFYGVSGFRVDAAFALMEDKAFTDEAMKPDCTDTNNYGCYYHKFTADTDETYQVLTQMRSYLDTWTVLDNVTRMMVTESCTDDWTKVKNYYSYMGKPVAHFPFNFFLITKINQFSNASNWVNIMNLWKEETDGWVSNWVLGNHDQTRVADRVGREMVDGLNMLLMLMEGTVFTYYGEEIGLTNSEVKPEHRVDKYMRDFQRGPMPWTPSETKGFSTNETKWLPLTQDFWELNVESQDHNSTATHLSIYRRMAKLRKSYILKSGPSDISTVDENKEVLSVTRWAPDNPSIVGVMNMGTETQIVNLQKNRPSLPQQIYLYANSINYSPSTYKLGLKFNSSEITIQPNAAMVFISQDTSIPIKINDNSTMILS